MLIRVIKSNSGLSSHSTLNKSEFTLLPKLHRSYSKKAYFISYNECTYAVCGEK